MSEPQPTAAEAPPASIAAAQALFAPGAGQTPPFFAGRQPELQRIANVLRSPLGKGAPPSNAVLLHGVRGSGKTCLMRQALSEFPPEVRVVDLDADDFLSTDALAKEIVAQAMAERDVPRRSLHFSAGLQVAGTGGHFTIGRGDPAPAHTITSVLGALRFCAKGVQAVDDAMPGAPLLIAIDEVQSVKGSGREDRLKSLLKGVQRACGADAQWPVGLIMVGTPDAYGHIRACGTFAERMAGFAPLDESNIPLGGLSEDATDEALVQPLMSCGIAVDDAVLDLAWRETSGHAYFVQALGRCLCRSLKRNAPDAQSIDLPLAEAALPEFSALKRQRYEERRMELQGVGSLEAALQVANAIFKAGRITSDQLNALCADGITQRDAVTWSPSLERSGWAKTEKDAKQSLLHAGLIWGENGSKSAEYHFGIPSFAAHAVAYAATCGVPHLQTMAAQINRDSKNKKRAPSSLTP